MEYGAKLESGKKWERIEGEGERRDLPQPLALSFYSYFFARFPRCNRLTETWLCLHVVI